MDLSSIFGLNSRFGEGLCLLARWLRSHLLYISVYQRVNGGSRLLEPSGRRRSGFAGQLSLSHWLSCASVRVVTGCCDEKLRSGLPTIVTVGGGGGIAGHFSKSVRSGAPRCFASMFQTRVMLCRVNRARQPGLTYSHFLFAVHCHTS